MAKTNLTYSGLYGRSQELMQKLRDNLPEIQLTKEQLKEYTAEQLLRRKQYLPNGAKLSSNALQYAEQNRIDVEQTTQDFRELGAWNVLDGFVGFYRDGLKSLAHKALIDVGKAIGDTDSIAESTTNLTIDFLTGKIDKLLIDSKAVDINNPLKFQTKDSNDAVDLLENFKKVLTGIRGMANADEKAELLDNFVDNFSSLAEARARQYMEEESVINDLLKEQGIQSVDSGGLIGQAQSILTSARSLNEMIQ